MTRSLARNLAIATMALVVAACGGAGSAASPNPVGGSSPSSAPTQPSQVPTSSAAAGTPVPSNVGASPSAPSASHADPALEAELPAEVSGSAMQRSSATLAALFASGGDRTAVDAFLRSLGKSESDGTFAAAFDPTNVLGGGIFAFRIAGVDAATLLPAIVLVEQADLGTGATTRQASVAGKGVTVVSVGTGVNDTEWIYGRDDVVFVVHAADEASAANFLQALR